MPAGAVVATSSTRRKAQLLAHHSELKIVDIRGNVATRMQKLMDKAELDATVLALAGITRLNFKITPEGKLLGDAVPDGLLAIVLDLDVMLPCVGQGAIGIEVRADDERIAKICERLNHYGHASMRHRRARLSRGDGRRLPKPGRRICGSCRRATANAGGFVHA